MAEQQRRRRVPWWSTALTALAAVLALVAPTHAPTSEPLHPGVALATWGFPVPQAPVDLSAAAGLVQPAVVQIDTEVDYQQISGNGTGIVLSAGGEVLTNFHVVQGANTIQVTSAATGRTFVADLLGYDRHHDVALIQVRGADGLPTAPIGDSSTVAVGDPVIGIGNAGGTSSPPTQDPGNVTALNRTISAEDALTGSSNELTGLIEVSAYIRPGDSGGPLVNAAGQVIGMTSAATVNYRLGPTGEGFAIPINQAMAIAGQIRSRTPSGSVHIGQPAMLGVGVLTSRQPRNTAGVIVRDVLPGGPAQQAGMLDGEVITALDGTPIDSATTLVDVLDGHYPGDVVDLTWLDGAGQQRIAKVTLASGP